MLKDPVFNISEKTLEFINKGIFFQHQLFMSPFGSRKIPHTFAIIDPNNERWGLMTMRMDRSPFTMCAIAKHGTGIYHASGFDNFVNEYSDSKLIDDVASFSLSSGEYYTYSEQAEAFKSVFDLKDKNVGDLLSNGKVIFSFNGMAEPYGMADNITQILKYYRKVITNPNYDVALTVRVLKHRKGEDHAGMRWHKQGKYLGNFKKQHEYISDEVGLGELISFNLHVYAAPED